MHRTTRSVRLSDAGERLYAAVRPALAEVAAAVAAVGALSDEPRGTIRLLIATSADPVLRRLPLADFLTAQQHVRLDIVVSDAVVDIVAAGFDAGIQLGEVIDRDMVAVPVTGDIRMTVVGSPAYLARHGTPQHPRDLVGHECLNWHPVPEAPPYRYEDQVRDEVARGELLPVLQAFCEPFSGYYLHYPQRRHASPALRALIDYLRRARQGSTAREERPTAERRGAAKGERARGANDRVKRR